MKFYFFDTCAVARYYCSDIGTNIIKQIVDSESTGSMIFDLSSVEVVSALVKMKRGGHIGFGEAEFNLAIADFQADIGDKFHLIESEDKHYKLAIDLIKKYDIDSADALIVAASISIADAAATKGHEVVFVTSDRKPYVVACEESKNRDYYSAFHFWKCKCEHCGNVIDIVKCTKITCPSCQEVICERCEVVSCKNTYVVSHI